MIKNKNENIKIIDVHVHLGYDHVYDCENKIDRVLEGIKKNNIFNSFLIPFTNFYEEDAIKNHDIIFEACNDYPGKFYGICCFNPHLKDNFVRTEIKRCINDLNFIGIKLNPQAHAVHPLSKDAGRFFQLASELNVPIMVHTGSGTPFTLPSLLIPVLEQYIDLKVVILHAGLYFPEEALIVAERYDNVFLETTWTPVSTIGSFIKNLGSDRIMFGSDHVLNMGVELEKYKILELKNNDLRNCLQETASKVFNIEI